MGNPIIDTQLHHFRVHHDELDLIGLGLVEQGQDQRVHAHGFARTGGTGNEHMRQPGNVADNAVAADVLADGKGELGFAVAEFRRVDDLAGKDGIDGLVGHLDADHGDFVRDRGDTNACGAQRKGNVVGQIGDL